MRKDGHVEICSRIKKKKREIKTTKLAVEDDDVLKTK